MFENVNNFCTQLNTINLTNTSNVSQNPKWMMPFEIFKIEPPKQKTPEEILYENRTLAIQSIIDEDKNAPKNLDSENLAKLIMQTGQEAGVDPLLIACICKKETHFTQEENGTNGKGIMQITSIVPKDMFQRTGLYDPEIKPVLDKYGSLKKAFEAKKNDPKIDLGDFGEILYKYKTPENLYEALKTDVGLNLKCGAYLMKFHLNANNGDIRKSLEAYNATSAKHSYAKKVMSYMDTSKSLVKLHAYV